MQLDFGFPQMPVRPRSDPPSTAARRPPRQQYELSGTDRLQQHTYFFAVLPDHAAAAGAGDQARALSLQIGSATRLIAVSRLHVSLFCIRKQSARMLAVEDEADVMRAARSVRVSPFDIHGDRIVSFGRPDASTLAKRPIVLTFGRNAGFKALADRLFAALSRAGIVGGKLRPFTPHMTLFYESAAILDEAIAPLVWTARDFHLIHSLHGRSQYNVLATFPLRD